jgi:hypothetical protein
MEAHWSGNALLRTVRVFQLPELHKALHFTKESCTFLEEWMMIIRSFVIYGSWIWQLRLGRRSLFQKVHLSQAQEAVIVPAFSKIRCISLVES